MCLDTSEDDLVEELYTPCFEWAERFDQGVGYFTTGWLTYNIAGLSDFAARGGKIHLITSPILSQEDADAIIGVEDLDGSQFARFEAALLENVETRKREMQADIINTFSWMFYDGIIEMRLQFLVRSWKKGASTISLAFSIGGATHRHFLAQLTIASMVFRTMRA